MPPRRSRTANCRPRRKKIFSASARATPLLRGYRAVRRAAISICTSARSRPSSPTAAMDFNLDDADFLAGTDVVGTKLDLARAYIDMGDHDSALDILKEVMSEGNPQQKQEAQTLSQQLA